MSVEVFEENIEKSVLDLINKPAYTLLQAEKEDLLLPLLKKQIQRMIKRNVNLNSMYGKLNEDLQSVKKLSDIPFIPVQMFKKFDLTTCDKSEITRIVKSSSTTGQNPSRVPIDRITSSRQTKAIVSTLLNYLGTKRRPFLVIDSKSVNSRKEDLTARGAAIRGLSTFAKSITYALVENKAGDLELDKKVFEDFCEKYRDKEVYVFGFTFMLWTYFAKQLTYKPDMNFKDIKVFHSGGWKKIKDQSVSEEIFSNEIAKLFNTEKGNIHNFYGMAEQTGIIFVDCEEGNKHIPNFADVIIRNPKTLEECGLNEPGLIEIISALGNSYPSQALLTEDLGVLLGVDDCPCGRKGKYIKFLSRVEKVEIRGCGDTFTQK